MSREHFYQTSKEILKASNKGLDTPAMAKARHIKARAEQGDNTPFEAVFIRAKQFIDELEAQKELLKLNEVNMKDCQDKEDMASFDEAFYFQCDILRDRIKDFIANMFGYDLNEMEYTYNKAE
ncbi:hypothetical protein [Campylobacter sp. CCUG 57310]|uniref:hypothetical protein n=1 Tax=Campylobacter sp. CCUG 57310 TaxID=2517362 RepID=UPI0015670A35|nr:hypothetical protein [Campylobacter sp. CCUG 57310]QKF93132.1 hypothetical protein CORI_1980 [Campylobacter sp. CCUG 57310]